MNKSVASLFAVALLSLTSAAFSQTTLHYENFDGPPSWSLSSSYARASRDLPSGVEGHPSGNRGLRFWDATLNGGGPTVAWALSPIVDLTGTTDPVLTFWMAWVHELDCAWDADRLTITRVADGQVVWNECLSTSFSPFRRWYQVQRDLDPTWGEIQVGLSYDPIDFWNFGDDGSVYDDVRITESLTGASTLCLPAPRVDGSEGPRMRATGSISADSRDLRIIGSSFEPNTFAAGFIGTGTALLPAGNGLRCIAGGGTSRRLLVAPTRDFGTPYWTLVTDDPSYGSMFLPGESVFVQAYYRDGSSFNFSEALRLDLTN